MQQKTIINTARSCHGFKELGEKLQIGGNIYYVVRQLNILNEIKLILKQNGLINNKISKRYSKEFMMDLANKHNTLQEIGNSMGLTRERIRQILHQLNIHGEVKEMLRTKRRKQ
jgi:5-bromo-4-chloroindolyl phosphate hydrolysis protein